MHLNEHQQKIASQLTWPGHLIPGASHGWEKILHVNGVRVVLYPSGMIDILSVADSDSARRSEQQIRAKHGHLILGHTPTYRLALTDEEMQAVQDALLTEIEMCDDNLDAVHDEEELTYRNRLVNIRNRMIEARSSRD